MNALLYFLGFANLFFGIINLAAGESLPAVISFAVAALNLWAVRWDNE